MGKVHIDKCIHKQRDACKIVITTMTLLFMRKCLVEFCNVTPRGPQFPSAGFLLFHPPGAAIQKHIRY